MNLSVGMQGNYDGVLGTITGQDGGTFEFSTPHGTKLKVGFFYLAKGWKELSSEDKKRLTAYEYDADLCRFHKWATGKSFSANAKDGEG